MKKYYFVPLLFLFCSHACATEEWLSNEVLQQLHELRSDIRGLKDEVDALRKEVASFKGTARNNEKAARGPAVPKKVVVGQAPIQGNKQAKVAIIEYTDFQCPFCSRNFRQTYPKLVDKYVKTGKASYVAKDFPLSFHSNAKGAAIAARCAGKQGKYWEMHDALFANQRQLGDALFHQEADTLNLDVKKYEHCLKDPTMEKVIARDLKEGESYGVTGTPAFLIGLVQNGIVTNITRVTGAQPYESFERIIDKLLK